MTLLLDTHIAIWLLEDSPRLSRRARELLTEPDARLYVSLASVWEIAIKHALGRGPATMPVSAQLLLESLPNAGVSLAPILPAHVLALERLPPLHGDPFDRLIVATALSEPYRLVTHDARLGAYSTDLVIVA